MKSDLKNPTTNDQVQAPSQATERAGQKPEKSVFEVTVAGLPLKLKTSHDQETVNQLVQFVDKKIQEAAGATKSGFQTATVLACLNLAEELILLKRKARTEIDRLETKTRRVITELESSQEKGLDH
jgi:cell division protein ZapA